jgi:hypothetical protein
MKRAAQVVSLAALAGTILPPVLYFAGRMDLETMKWAMLVATVAWVAATPLWMKK